MTDAGYEIYFRRPDDCVVYAADTSQREVSLLHHQGEGEWHCALCDSTRCRHTEVATRTVRGRASTG